MYVCVLLSHPSPFPPEHCTENITTSIIHKSTIHITIKQCNNSVKNIKFSNKGKYTSLINSEEQVAGVRQYFLPN